MKKIIVLTVMAIASQAVAIFAGEPVVSSKQVITPPPPPPPEFFRPNEFDIGAFGTYATGVGSGERAGRLHGWGGGMDFTYWFPWKYAGVRFPRSGTRYQWRWRSTKQSGYFSRRGNCNCFRRRRQCAGGCGYGRLHVAIAVRYLLAELSSGTVRVRGYRWRLYR